MQKEPMWQRFCYAQPYPSWRWHACFYVAGLLLLTPAPFHSAWKPYHKGSATTFVIVLLAIPVGIFSAGFVAGRLM